MYVSNNSLYSHREIVSQPVLFKLSMVTGLEEKKFLIQAC